MKSIILTGLILFSVNPLFGQNRISFRDGNEIMTFWSDTTEACDKEVIFTIVESMPTYKGGFDELQDDLNNAISLDKSVQGESAIWFVINCNGKAYGFQVIRSVDKIVEIQLINELKLNQGWVAGKHRGNSIDCDQMLRVRFKKGKIRVLNK